MTPVPAGRLHDGVYARDPVLICRFVSSSLVFDTAATFSVLGFLCSRRISVRHVVIFILREQTGTHTEQL